MKLPLIIAAAAILATGAAQAQLQQAGTCSEAAAFQKQQCGAATGGRIAVCQNNIEQARQNCMQTGKWGGRNLRRE